MNSIAIILVLASCVTHAGWNLVSKSKTPSAAFFALSTSSSVLVMTPLYLFSLPYLSRISPVVWGLLVVTGFFQALYFISLGNSYRLNDISLAYPISRSLPVLMVPLVCFIIGYGKPLSILAIVGMIITAVGCMILPLKVINASVLKHYFQYSFLFVLLAAVGTTGYSIIDSMGLELLRTGSHPLSTMQAASFYVAFEDLMTILFLWPYVKFSRREKINLRIISKRSLRYPLLAGPVVAITYWLVLMAMQFATNVSYIVAFRQVSILIGVLLGIFILKEKSTPFKLTGTALIFAGLVLAAIG
jgi:drug/metabolite transporter (DMT)-like permease